MIFVLKVNDSKNSIAQHNDANIKVVSIQKSLIVSDDDSEEEQYLAYLYDDYDVSYGTGIEEYFL